MIKWKVQSKVSLLLACLLCFSAYNPALAQDVILADPGSDVLIQDEPPLLAPADEPALVLSPPASTYSADNPFANSQYTDIADLAELLLKQGYNVDSYFYSEGFTTGMDGTLGNEYVCIRDDTNKVYIGRSDVCVNREMDSTYSYIQIDKMDWSKGFPDLTILQSGDLLGDDYTNWTGCYEYNAGWNGTSGGYCPALQTSGQIIFGYMQQTLTNLAAIDLALKDLGIETTGYNYSWRVKNWDTNYRDLGNGRSSPDPLQVTVAIKDDNNNVVFSKTYDYSFYIPNWTTFSGEEVFEEPINGEKLSELELSVTGRDLGYWAGHYGPEFLNPSIKLNYRTVATEDTTVEDALFNSKCTADPLSDPLCPGYNDAMMAQITGSSTIAEIVESAPNITESTVESVITESIPVVEATGSSDPVAEATAEAVASATPSNNTGSSESSTTEEATAEATADPSKPSTSLSATQLNALNAANEVANSAVGIAQDAATTSSGIGLSESGGVSSDLTAVDTTGTLSADGSVNANAAGSVTSMANSDNGSQTGSDDGSQTASSSTVTGSSDSADDIVNGNTGSTNSDSGQTEQDAALAEGGAVETEDITGEQTLAAANKDLSESLSLSRTILEEIINGVVSSMVDKAVEDANEIAEESSEESIEEQNKKEDDLVKQAQDGSKDEDAMAALLGFNPNFRAYQQPQMPGGDIYSTQGIYENQKTWDNPSSRLFNGASDAKHREMVRQQYELGK